MFVAIGVDHAGEQENKLLKLEGGLTGIANNENARNRFLLTAPILRQFCDDFYKDSSKKSHHNLQPGKTLKQENRVSKIVKTFETYANPFSIEDEGTLRNLYTNVVVPSKYVEDIINKV